MTNLTRIIHLLSVSSIYITYSTIVILYSSNLILVL